MAKKLETFKSSLTSGLIHRGGFKNKIQTFCFHEDIDFNLTENKELFESTLLYEFKGSKESIERLKIFIDGLLNPYKPRFDEYTARRIVQDYAKSLQQPLDGNAWVILVGCRPESLLKNSVYDISEALKQVLLLTTDNEARQAIVDGYVLLGSFITQDYYQKLVENTQKMFESSQHKKLTKKEHKETKILMREIENYISKAQEVLAKDIEKFQIANGFYG